MAAAVSGSGPCLDDPRKSPAPEARSAAQGGGATTIRRCIEDGFEHSGPLALVAAIVERAEADAAGQTAGLPNICEACVPRHRARPCGQAYLAWVRSLSGAGDTDPIDLALRVLAAAG